MASAIYDAQPNIDKFGNMINRNGGQNGTGGGFSAPLPTGFNLNPSPQGGNGPFGAVPGALGLPDPAGDLTKRIPNLPQLNSGASNDILSKLSGTLSPSTLTALQTAQAQYGGASGMPGSQLNWNALYGNIAGASEAQQQQGIQDYNSFLPTVSGTQTVAPALQNEIATQNSLNAAAPNPTAAASYAEQLFNKYLAMMRGPAGGTSGSSGNPAAASAPDPFHGGVTGQPGAYDFSQPSAPTPNASPGSFYFGPSDPSTDIGSIDFNSGENSFGDDWG